MKDNKNKVMAIEIAVYAALVAVAILNQGVMCNDEVQHRFRSFYGIREFFSTFVSEQMFSKGRALAAVPSTIFLYMGFASPERLFERISALIAIGLCIFMIFRFMNLLFHNKFLNYLYVIVLIGFIPITFEHAAPNAFVTVYSYPFVLLIASWINYVKYLRNGQKKHLVYTLILLFIPLVSYEIFVTYTPLYLFLAFYESKEDKFIKKFIYALKKFMIPCCCAIFFLIAYVVASKVFVSTYEGNQLGNFTILGALNIIKQLSLSSIPGYFLFNSKYKFLYSVYAEKKGDTVFKTMLLNIDLYKILLVIMVVLVLFHILKMQKEKKRIAADILIVLVGVLFIMLPTLPLSVSSMYQGNVTSENFTALPVTFYSYFASCFVISYIINIIRSRVNQFQIVTYLLLCPMVVGIFSVQSMNTAFSVQQKANFDRMQRIESMIDSEFFKQFNNKTIYSEDIYKVYNLLAYMPAYWDQYASKDGLNIQFVSEKKEDNWSLLDIDGDYFELVKNNQVIVITSRNESSDKFYLNVDGSIYRAEANSGMAQLDNKCMIFYFTIQDSVANQVGADGVTID